MTVKLPILDCLIYGPGHWLIWWLTGWLIQMTVWRMWCAGLFEIDVVVSGHHAALVIQPGVVTRLKFFSLSSQFYFINFIIDKKFRLLIIDNKLAWLVGVRNEYIFIMQFWCNHPLPSVSSTCTTKFLLFFFTIKLDKTTLKCQTGICLAYSLARNFTKTKKT